MDSLTWALLITGGVGVALLVIALVLGEILNLGHVDADGPFSLPAIAAFVGGAGFVGALAASLLPGGITGGGRVVASVGIGLVGATPLAYGAIRLTRGLMGMRTDGTLTDTDLLGAQGTVITAIPGTGYGEVRLTVGGHQLKYSARAPEPLPAGTPVFVTDALSATAVEVVSTAFDR